MDVKKILKDPQTYFASLKTPPSIQVCNQLLALQQRNRVLAKKLKALQLDKGHIAHSFRSAKADPTAMDRLKPQMQQISINVAEAESALKKILLEAASLLQHQAPAAKPLLPKRFTHKQDRLGKGVQFRWLTDPQEPLWQIFVEQSVHTSVYHLPAIQTAIQKVFGHSSSVLLALDEGTVVGGLPLTLVCSQLFGRHGVSVPFFNYGGPLTAYRDVAEKLIEQSRTALVAYALEQVEIRTTTAGLPFPCSDRKVSMIRRLPALDGELDRELGSKVRAQVNRALPHRPCVRFGGGELLDDFYSVFAINMRDLGTPVYGKAWFAHLLAAQELTTTLVVCYIQDKPVSVGFLLGYRDTLEIPWASTLRSANGLNMNMWMYRQILSYSIAQGYGYFDFGRSTQDGSTYRFKKQWGALPVPHYWYYQTSAGIVLMAHNPDNLKFKPLIAIWKRLPVWLTKLIGPAIVKNIS
ncbi:FemAB family XrtA/PEP-CTERM system-associated protein [Reinekea sp.]|jgi:FemAB-related protein (PEP-CTERM system-associated)|uniref:FemAB family XrtA/PEP-CTERM system-associated protein n=1 Tax=Reinekea sp. TaxID=1970455 RepID=UPI002A833F27|nr:FemAB family XrtA/PEP-CTERM system-associated protein [Reinekea sp.]